MNFARLQAVYNSFWMKILDVKVGQFLEIHETIGEGSNQRNRRMRCLVYSVKNAKHPNWTFLVRGISSGVTIEKIYPLCFQNFSKVILLDEFKVRRSKLYFLRNKLGKSARLKSIITPERRNIDLLTLERTEVQDDVEMPTELIDDDLKEVNLEADAGPVTPEETTKIDNSKTEQSDSSSEEKTETASE